MTRTQMEKIFVSCLSALTTICDAVNRPSWAISSHQLSTCYDFIIGAFFTAFKLTVNLPIYISSQRKCIFYTYDLFQDTSTTKASDHNLYYLSGLSGYIW